ncbi:MAG: cation diffusion facilitator family transporter [Pyramidobacter sp.]|jgi:cation diffusion facilitator family transporter
MKQAEMSKSKFEEAATHVSVVCMAGNLILAAAKFVAGFAGNSGAMVSDAVHSSSDILGGLIVVAGVKMASRPSDKTHPYGHERIECIAALLLGGILFVVGLTIGWEALKSIFTGAYRLDEQPGVIALAAAVLSIVSKEAMFWYTWATARRFDSASLRAEAWHHRSDALSSVGALIGIAGARLGRPVMEPAASFVICLFILKAGIDIFRDTVDKLVDHASDDKTVAALRRCVMAQPGVMGIDLLNTREFGNRIYVDIEIRVDGSLTLREAHGIAENVHHSVEKEFAKVKHVMVHVNPA